MMVYVMNLLSHYLQNKTANTIQWNEYQIGSRKAELLDYFDLQQTRNFLRSQMFWQRIQIKQIFLYELSKPARIVQN